MCDHKLKIRDIFVGYPGSVHDSRVFRTSPLSNTLAEKCGDYYILGDSGYPCLQHLLTPYRDRGQLHRAALNYNLQLAKNRYVIEHCFGVLKQKFRQLYHIKLQKIEDIVHFIRACCVLHNIAIDDEINFDENIDHIEIEINNNHGIDDDERDERGGVDRRNYIADYVLNI